MELILIGVTIFPFLTGMLLVAMIASPSKECVFNNWYQNSVLHDDDDDSRILQMLTCGTSLAVAEMG
jgi:hypothetical protein